MAPHLLRHDAEQDVRRELGRRSWPKTQCHDGMLHSARCDAEVSRDVNDGLAVRHALSHFIERKHALATHRKNPLLWTRSK